MLAIVGGLAVMGGVSALPQTGWVKNHAPWKTEDVNSASMCLSPYSKKPDMPYSKTQNISPRIQWNDAGGYCGSMSIQDVSLGTGVWISQQQVRNHTVPGGGNDNEILATNIETALTNLKLTFEGFDYKNSPTPQADAYRKFIKKHLVAGNGLAWMIMLSGGHYPVYPGLPYGFYSHVEPVYGIYSNHPLTDDTWYPDDVLQHGTDAAVCDYYRTFESLPAGITKNNVSECGEDYLGYPCIYEQYGFGWAITGQNDPSKRPFAPVSLSVDSPEEPDTRAGQKPTMLKGTVEVTDLTVGTQYELYRWDSSEAAFDYSQTNVRHSFTASDTTFMFNDDKGILSSGVTYYRCVVKQ